MSPTVRYATPGIGTTDREGLISNILAFGESLCSGTSSGEWGLADGWVRIPVSDFATLHNVDRRTVQRALDAAEHQGLIQSEAPRKRRGGRVVCHRLIRLLPVVTKERPHD